MDRVRHRFVGIYNNTASEIRSWRLAKEQDISKLPPYKYRSLEPHEIRYVILLRGEEHENINVEIEHEDQGARRGYAALSYVWGEPNNRPKSILVKGRRVHRTTYNLWTALKRIRRNDADLVLWIDAICINQSSKVEKSQQLPNMRWIYPRAEKVLCWLGDGDETIPEAFNALKAWANAYEDPELRKKLVANTESYLASRRPGSQNGLSRLFNRPYWRRAWCLPEVCVDSINPPILLCGDHELSWSDLYKGFLCMGASLDDCALLIGTNVGYLLPMIKTCWRPEEDLRMSELVPDAAIREAHDPHDIIFSLLGLAERRGVEYPAPDYERTIEETCIVYTRAIISIDERLDILGTVDSAREGDTVPSWSIKPGRWAKFQTTEIRRLDQRRHGGIFRYSATKDSKPVMRKPDDALDPVLGLSGREVDTVLEVLDMEAFSAKSLKAGQSWIEIMEASKAFCSRHFLDSQHATRYKDTLEAFLNTITCDDFWVVLDSWWHSNSEDRLFAAYQTHFKSLQMNESTIHLDKTQLLKYMRRHFSFDGRQLRIQDEELTDELRRQPTDIHDFLERRVCNEFRRFVQNKLAERKFVVTEQGYFGVGPRECRSGDRVCLLLGSSVPFILRRVEDREEDRYLLVGDAFVNGLMYGEGLDEEIAIEGSPGVEPSGLWTTFNIL